VIAANQGAAVHRITIRRVNERLSISLDLEEADIPQPVIAR
jgi:hypothetical protein